MNKSSKLNTYIFIFVLSLMISNIVHAKGTLAVPYQPTAKIPVLTPFSITLNNVPGIVTCNRTMTKPEDCVKVCGAEKTGKRASIVIDVEPRIEDTVNLSNGSIIGSYSSSPRLIFTIGKAQKVSAYYAAITQVLYTANRLNSNVDATGAIGSLYGQVAITPSNKRILFDFNYYTTFSNDQCIWATRRQIKVYSKIPLLPY